MAEIKAFPGTEETTEKKEKQKVSNILSEKREWHKVKDKLPTEGEKVVIRIVNDNILFGEDENTIYPVEDVKIGEIIDGKFVICKPFPLFDYSPLSDKGVIKEGAYVSHWAYPEKGELEGWETRFEPFHEYKKLSIDVDDENIERVYRAILFGASALSRLYGAGGQREEGKEIPDELKEIDELYCTLCDLQACMDKAASQKE